MTREWKPGDVAMARLNKTTEIRVMWMGDGVWRGVKGGFCDLHLSARPLVVIDPEDREQVERLIETYMNQFDDYPATTTETDHMQAALREFASPTPPRPEEPTGLGAVVEDEDGVRWVRKGNSSHGEDWSRQIGDAWTGGAWGRIAAVRVLSEGVQ